MNNYIEVKCFENIQYICICVGWYFPPLTQIKHYCFKASHEDIHVEVYVQGKLLLKADGKEDYYTKFDNILQSFIERKVHGCHTLSSQADFNLHYDGSVTLNTTYIMHEKNKGELSPEKVWKSSGYYVNTWVPPVEGSLSVKDWRILTYYVYVLETSDDFGKSSDACDGLC